MVKTKFLIVRITEDQLAILEARTRNAGFLKISEYVRIILFKRLSFDEKLDQIYDKVIKNGR